MKRLLYLLILTVALSSCGPTPQEQAIIDYEQTVDGTKTDLSMKIISNEKIGTLTFKDSAAIYKDIFEQELSSDIRKSELRIIEYKEKVVESLYAMSTARLAKSIEHYKKSIDMYNGFAAGDSLRVQKLKSGDYSKTKYENKYKLLKRYENSSDSIIADKFLTNYSIKNPFLNGTKQELKKEYWIKSDNKIIYSETKTE